MASEIKVDTISEKTPTSGVTIDGVLLKDGSINANGTGRKNYIINGNFDIWQRGTSETGRTALGYAADRWYINPSGGTIASSQEAFTVGQTDVPNEPAYFYRFTNSVAADNAGLWQKIEGVRSLAGQTATISFYAKYTTNAPTSLTLDINQDFGSSGSTDVVTSIQTGVTLTTSWQKFTYTFTPPSISGKTVAGGDDNLAIRIGNPNTEIWDMDIAQVQVEKGSVATDFEVRYIGEELDLCQRYFYIPTNNGIDYSCMGTYYNNTSFYVLVNLPTTMRIAPTTTFVGTIGDFSIANAGVTTTVTSATAFNSQKNMVSLDFTTGSRTTGHGGFVRQANSDTYIEFDAEL